MDTVISMIKDHHLWLSSGGKEGKQAVFTGYDLSGLDSDYAEARYIVPPFWEKNLSKIDLSYSNLSGLYFREVNLSQADFRGANLKNAHFYQATLYKADFSGADISEAYIEESSLNQANLTKTDLSKTRIAYSHLEDANLQDANCRETNFQRAQLRGANLHGADFYGARFVATTIEENQFIHIRFPESIESPCWDTGLVSLQAQALESENKIRQLEHELELTDKENKAEVKKLQDQLQYERVKSQQISELGLNKRIEDAQKALAGALKNTDKQIQINEDTARLFKWLGIVLFSMGILLIISFSGLVVCLPELLVEKNLNILFYTFPIVALILIGTTCLRHQKNLLAEIRHFSNMKHQIELYSGLLEASRHAAASYYEPEKAGKYVQETFTQIRNRLLSNPYLPDNSPADKQSENDLGSDKVLDLLNKIADLSGKKPMGN
ncbi:pentapeptide repeat-containing protein [Neisseria mucosa]|uniref:pentapeptide repeat-containing protein n=1 Tax=Neisseria mucosa TaxID=488 RepID=UPI00187780BF|nr:pentapeptide repeat-containing protein [Neisseria mucosa]